MVNAQIAIVDAAGVALRDPAGSFTGQPGDPLVTRWVWALPEGISGLSRRYAAHPPKEACYFGMDFSPVVPRGSVIGGGTVLVFTNTFVTAPVESTAWAVGPVMQDGRRVFALFSGGVEGTDYQIRWTVADTVGNVWVRTALCLCSQTS